MTKKPRRTPSDTEMLDWLCGQGGTVMDRIKVCVILGVLSRASVRAAMKSTRKEAKPL
jgi:hypothetical protein